MLWWFYSFETQSQSRIPPVRSYRWKNCVLGAFPVLVSEVTASSDSTVNRSVYKLSRKASLLIKTRMDSEAVDGLMAAVLFDLDAKEMNPQTRFNKKKSPKHNIKKGENLLSRYLMFAIALGQKGSFTNQWLLKY